MSDDPDWEVRRAVARELAKSNNPKTQAIAQKYLHDRSTQVQQATLESLRYWHPETTAAMLFDAMDGNALETRMIATEMLARYWEPARQYQPNGRTEQRKQHYRQLAVQFQHDMQRARHEGRGARGEELSREVRDENHEPGTERSAVPGLERGAQSPDRAANIPEPTQADYDRVRMLLAQLHQGGTQTQYQNILVQLAETGPMLEKILEQLVIAEGRPLHDTVYRRVLPGIDSLFEISNRLEDNEISRRRVAAAELVGATKFENVSPLLYRQLAAHAVREQDEIVLLRFWDFLDRQAERLLQCDIERRETDEASDILKWRELLVRSQTQLRKSLTTGSLAHVSPELHRRACVHIRDYGHPDDMPMLLAEIRHPVPSVSRAALQALARLGTIECAGHVRPLLSHAQPLVVVDAALALDRWGDPAGTNALERLVVSGDRTTKLAVVQGIKRGVRDEGRGTRDEMREMRNVNFSPLTPHHSPLSRHVPLLVRLLDETGAIRQEALDALPLVAGYDVVPPQETAYYSPQERIELWKNYGPDDRLPSQIAR
ncbi:MAG: HEAT repeat domain-containing protein, partial [Planctomycetaceae bacterium]|nr:HEAT repeat domain-containing protein [Planctomycetaceae bacterium]